MDEKYLAGGTIRTCPYAESPEIVTFIKNGSEKKFDRSLCSHSSECDDKSCPLCIHLDN